MPDKQLHFPLSRAVFLLIALPGWCMALFVLRILRAGGIGYHYLVWNLVLAVVPAAAALMLVRAEREHATLPEQAGWFALWLLFLPNAPYLLTDLVHLSVRPPVPAWYDIALLLSFGCAGLLLCYGSLADVHAVVARRWGAAAGWTLALASLLLSGLGIYLGRFLRWNSWDPVTRPDELFGHLRDALAEPSSPMPGLHVTLVYGIGLTLGYVGVHLILPRDPAGRGGARRTL